MGRVEVGKGDGYDCAPSSCGKPPREDPLRISGFTIARKAVAFGYPLAESLRSLLPLVDEMVVNVGDADDGTWETVQALADPKIVAFRSTWDLNKHDGLTLSEETNKALALCRGEWAIYLQADEVLHERDLPALRAALERYREGRTEALSLRYYHFYGSYQTYKDDPRLWYRRATRIIRTGIGIESVGDACAFMRRQGDAWRKPKRRDLGVYVYHYGRVRPPEQMVLKQLSFERLYRSDAWLAQHGLSQDMAAEEVYTDTGHLRAFRGTHPEAMRDRIASADWPAPRPGTGPWPEWLRRSYVYGGWLLERGLAALRRRP